MLNVYRASAGSGKTYRLTYEYIKMMLGRRDYNREKSTGAYLFYDNYSNPHRRILAVTFTNKATEEMKQRIVRQLDVLAHNPQLSDYCKDLCRDFSCGVAQLQQNATLVLQQLLHDFSYFNISTIDSFFQQVLRAFTREVGLQGGYEVEMDASYVTMAAIDRMFDDLDSNPEILDWLLQYAEENIRNNGSWNIHDKSDIPALARQLTSEVYKKYRDKLPKNDLKFYKEYIDTLTRYGAKIRREIAEKAIAAQVAVEMSGIPVEVFKRKWITKLDVLCDETITDIDAFGKAVDDFLKICRNPDEWFKKTDLKKLHRNADELYAALSPSLENLSRVLDNAMLEYRSIPPALKYIYSLGVLSTIDDNITKYEQEHNTLLLNKTPEILSGLINKSDAPFIYEKVGTRVAHYMIDEFQDTSGLQWKNFEPLVSESLAWNNENLIVGDVKQSIYRFRNSDWRLLHEGLDTYNYNLMNDGNDTNWRSCANVIAFNNSFFKSAARLLQTKLVSQIRDCLPDDNTLVPLIADIYAGVEQKVSPGHLSHSGHVELHVIEKVKKTIADTADNVLAEPVKKETFTEEVERRLPELLRNLLRKGYRAKDIAFLVSTNKDARTIVELLLALSAEDRGELRDIRVVSDESLLVTNAPPVKLILGILRYLQNPNYPINEFVLAYEYSVMSNKSGSESDALISYFDNRSIGTPIAFDLQKFISEIATKPLFEMCELIIHKFAMQKQTAFVAYIEAFQDLVLEYCRNHSADLYSFLRWWEDKGINATVKSPENLDAIRVMTIHKSKGLEFPVVIIPYASWSLSTGHNAPLKWYVPDREPFNLLPVLPVDHKRELTSTIFAKQYFEERISEYVDCLNMMYVAFTRAAQELIVYTYQGTKDSVGTIISEVLNMSVVEEDNGCAMLDFASHVEEDECEKLFEVGADWKPVFDNEPTAQMVDVAYRVVLPTDSRLRQRTKAHSVSSDRKRNYGILMHEILADIYTVADIPAVVERCVREGRLKRSLANKTKRKIADFVSCPEVARWFSSEVHVVTETDILKMGEKINRPDRVVIDGDKVTVIDYKFGFVESEEYKEKLLKYMQLIRDMGYRRVEGCIWYVEKGKFVQIETS